MIKKLLIANRGEIACRIIKTAKRLGVRTVAVYSDADANAQHVALADEAVRVGPAAVNESYLVAERIVAAAVQTGADAIHPGYGFLSENAPFAAACETAGINFVGPPSSAINAMGSKSEAKKIMSAAAVPLIPGYHGDDQTDSLLAKEADAIGYPVLIKASAGGGGRGMRVVETAEDFDKELNAARRESKGAFGDDHVLLEKYLGKPRHIEVQIFADTHGNFVHLFERDCSIQRRHQKVIEEAPAPGISQSVREAICASAIAAARAIDYVGAGTVEFLLDTTGEHYFMEMNTRLQVEHPVTELITGFDLVEWQLLVASGEPLPAQQSDIRINGHAVEGRLYAENPKKKFMPSTGVIQHLRFPEGDPAIRIDTGVRSGDEVSFYYDPMIAKVVAWGEKRTEAAHRLADALDDTEVVGIVSNATYLADMCRHEAFLSGDVHTGFIDEHARALDRPETVPDANALAVGAVALLETQGSEHRRQAAASGDPHSPWHQTNSWRVNGGGQQALRLGTGKEEHRVLARTLADGSYELTVGDTTVSARGTHQHEYEWLTTVDGFTGRASVVPSGPQLTVFRDAKRYELVNLDAIPEADDTALAGGKLLAPLPGKVISIAVEAGQKVAKGTTLLVLEAMKMEHNIIAAAAGTVTEIRFAVGDLVDEDAELIVLASD